MSNTAPRLHPTEIPLLPPASEQPYARHHWVERVDYDGHGCGLEVYQWQPHARKWCLPNRYAQGDISDVELKGYRYVAICPTPPFAEEVEEARKLLKEFEQHLRPEQKERFETLKRLIGEHLFTLPKSKRS